MENRIKCHSFKTVENHCRSTTEGSVVPTKEKETMGAEMEQTASPRELQGPCHRHKHSLGICSMQARSCCP